MADELRPPASAQEEIERKEMFLTWLWKEEKEEADAAAAAASETGSEAPERWYQPYTEYIPKDKKRQLKGVRRRARGARARTRARRALVVRRAALAVAVFDALARARARARSQFWENYDKDLSLGPQLVSKAEWEASKKIRVRVRLWIASKRHNARIMKKEYEIKNREAANVQKVYRGYQGRMLAKLTKQDAAKKETLMRDYQEWQEMLMKSSIKGPKVEKYDHAKGTFFVTQLSISGDRKFLSFKGPGMLGGAEKVKVNNIFAIERNPSPKMRKVRGGKKGDPNLHLCLRHKDFTNPDAKEMAVDLQVHTPGGKVASTERNRWYQSFLQLQV